MKTKVIIDLDLIEPVNPGEVNELIEYINGVVTEVVDMGWGTVLHVEIQ